MANSGSNPGINTGAQIVCVDLDGTLVQTDTLYELFALGLKKNILLVFIAAFWLLRGKAFFKAKLSNYIDLPPETLLYNDSVIDYIKNKHSSGALLYLVSASHQKITDAVARHLGLFTDQFGSDESSNIKGQAKADLLNSKFGEFGYEYIGNDESDLDIWKSSASAVVVGSNKRLIKKARKVNAQVSVLPGLAKGGWKSYLKLMRPHQWVKNVLLFVPLLLSHSFADFDKVFLTSFGFILFSLAASGIYVFNDLVDINHDRMHPLKAKRPLACGEVSITRGAILGTVLWSICLSLSFIYFDVLFFLIVGYIAINFLYSFLLKRLVLIDVVVLAGFYIIRIIVGAAIAEVELSFWLLTFSLFIFFSLALVKRYSEITLFTTETSSVNGRGYNREDEFITAILGITSGLISVLVMALYINDEHTRLMYSNSNWLWLTIPALLYWVSRLWLLAHRKVLTDDPIYFAIKDKLSYFILFTLSLSVYMAL